MMETRRKREHFVTCGQMKVLERRADADGLSYYQMMENAGTGAAQVILERMAHRRALQTRSDAAEPKRAEAVKFAAPAESDRAFVAEPKLAALAESSASTVETAAEDGNSIKSSNNDAHKTKNDLPCGTSSESSSSALVFCGKGNNGGDGFVVARVLSEAGYSVTVILVDGEPKTPDAVTNFELLTNLPVKVIDISREDTKSGMRAAGTAGKLLAVLKETQPSVIVDAIYGTGFHGALQGNAQNAAEAIRCYVGGYEKADRAATKQNALRPLVCALDIPSGLGGDALKVSQIDEGAIRADYTLTFHARKPVHLQKFAKAYCGEIIAIDIGIDEERLWGN